MRMAGFGGTTRVYLQDQVEDVLQIGECAHYVSIA